MLSVQSQMYNSESPRGVVNPGRRGGDIPRLGGLWVYSGPGGESGLRSPALSNSHGAFQCLLAPLLHVKQALDLVSCHMARLIAALTSWSAEVVRTG